MKKKISFILIIVILAALCGLLTACKKAEAAPYCVAFDGDVQDGLVSVDLNGIAQEKYSYADDSATVEAEGWNLNDVLKKANMLYAENRLMITGTDGTSVLIEARLTGKLYLYKNDNNELCARGVDYPRSTGIKGISEITVVTKENATNGYKILSSDNIEYVSRGNAKLFLFTLTATNNVGDNYAWKYLPSDNADRNVSHFTERDKNVVYFKDYDYVKNADYNILNWKTGGLTCSYGETAKEVYGFATGTDIMVSDAYYEMKAALDANKKVMLILPDGFSWEQANAFSPPSDGQSTQPLSLLNVLNAQKALSTHLSISPVALAAIVTGKTPYENGVHFDEGESRRIITPKVQDIFKYATDKGKSVKYLEGSGNLIGTSVKPVYGTSDEVTYRNAVAAINDDTDLIFVHFHETDDENHRSGPLSLSAKNKLLEIEWYIIQLKNQFSGTVIVIPDHGHNTLTDSDGKIYGQHGMFTNLDMYVPYYIFRQEGN